MRARNLPAFRDFFNELLVSTTPNSLIFNESDRYAQVRRLQGTSGESRQLVSLLQERKDRLRRFSGE